MDTKIKKITISGFKSISSANPLNLELGNISILLGANGSGKSNIIGFFKMLSSMMSTSNSFPLFVEQAGTSQVFLHYGSKITPIIEGNLCFENSEREDSYKFQLAYAAPDRLIISHEEISTVSKKSMEEAQITLPSGFFNGSSLVGSEHPIAEDVLRFVRGCKVYQFYDSSADARIRLSSPIDTASYLQSDGGNLASFLYYLKNNYSYSYKRIVRSVRSIMPQLQDFYLEPNAGGFVMLKWVDSSTADYVFTPQQLSDGTARFIALATLLLQPQETMPSVTIIDEPELGLHPYAIGELAEMIKGAALHTQIIVATQSSDLVDEFEAEQIKIVEYDESTGSTTVNSLRTDELSGWLKHYSLSELWYKNVIGGRP
jgi:predicted ATPase